MSILTKKERTNYRKTITTGIYDESDLIRALDTIDALEARSVETWDVLARAGIPDEDEQLELPLAVERLWLAYEGAAHNCSKYRKRVDALEAERDALHEKMSTIGAFAHFNHDTTTIGGAHAALREIAEMAGGGE